MQLRSFLSEQAFADKIEVVGIKDSGFTGNFVRFHTNVVTVGSHHGRIFLTSPSFFVGSDLGVWFPFLGGHDWQRASIDSFQAYRRARTSRIGQGTQYDRRVYRRLLGGESLVVEEGDLGGGGSVCVCFVKQGIRALMERNDDDSQTHLGIV